MDLELYDVYNEDTGRIMIITRQQLLNEGLHTGNVSSFLNKNSRSVGDYILIETYRNEQSLLKSTYFYTDKELLIAAFARYLTAEQGDIIINNGDQWLTDYSITSTFGTVIRAYCPRCN